MHAYVSRAVRIRTLGLLTAAVAAAGFAVAPAAQATEGSSAGRLVSPPTQIYCYTYTYNNQGSVDCTDSLTAATYFGSWSETGATSVYESTPYELGYYCRIGTAVTAVLHAVGGSYSWSGTCA